MSLGLCSKCLERPSKKSLGKGTSSWCNECSKAYERKRWNLAPTPKRRAKWLKTKYGLSYEEYAKMYLNQSGKCKVCQIEISIESQLNDHQTACVDHNHDTGEVRGLLCNHCNRAIGLMKENVSNIRLLAEYLEGKL